MEGDFHNDQPHGYTKIEFTDGCVFEGLIENGQLKKGVYIFPEGDQYTGEFVNGQMEGEGVYLSGMVESKGQFKNNLLNGSARRNQSDGKTEFGYFVNGRLVTKF